MQAAPSKEASFPDAPQPGFGGHLGDICGNMADPPAVIAALKERGITASPEQRFKEIAEANGMETMQLFEILHEIGNAL